MVICPSLRMSYPHPPCEGLSSLQPTPIRRGNKKIRWTLPSPFGRGAGGEGLELNASVARFNFGITIIDPLSPILCSFQFQLLALRPARLNSRPADILAIQWLFFAIHNNLARPP